MLEMLQVIVLACQVGNGSRTLQRVDEYQKKCQKELIECVNKQEGNGSRWSEWRAINCIKQR